MGDIWGDLASRSGQEKKTMEEQYFIVKINVFQWFSMKTLILAEICISF